MANERFPTVVEKMLLESGWTKGRDVLRVLRLPGELEIFPEAERILREFGGLRIGANGPGIDCAASDVNMKPYLGRYLGEIFIEEKATLGVDFYPLGMFHNDNLHLIVATSGEIYAFAEDFEKLGDSFDLVLTKVLLGLK